MKPIMLINCKLYLLMKKSVLYHYPQQRPPTKKVVCPLPSPSLPSPLPSPPSRLSSLPSSQIPSPPQASKIYSTPGAQPVQSPMGHGIYTPSSSDVFFSPKVHGPFVHTRRNSNTYWTVYWIVDLSGSRHRLCISED